MLIILDIETTGLDPAVHSILEIYAQIYDNVILDGVPREFHEYIVPLNCTWEMAALTMHINSGLLTTCTAGGKPLKQVMIAFASWIYSASPHDRVTIGGKAVGRFDLPFLYAADPSLRRYIRHNTLDIGSLLWEPSASMKVPSLAELCARHGLPKPVHLASSDVKACVSLFQKVLGRFELP